MYGRTGWSPAPTAQAALFGTGLSMTYLLVAVMGPTRVMALVPLSTGFFRRSRPGPGQEPAAALCAVLRTPMVARATAAAASIPMPPTSAQVRSASVKLAP